MIAPNVCPNEQTLASLLSGHLSSPEVEQIAQHLELCPNCAKLAEKIDVIAAANPLAATIEPSLSPTPAPDEERINKLINLLCDLGSQSRVPEYSNPAINTLWDVGNILIPSNKPEYLGRIGQYRVQSLLGAGGMGDVYLARQDRPNRPVALKIVRSRPGGDGDLLARFRAEAEAAARLSHPNIVQVYEAGECDRAAFIAMELVEGESLATRLSRALLAPPEAAELMCRLAKAVHFAHENGVVHRDLKPSNVLLDRNGVPKLSDFGLAKVLGSTDSDQTKTGAVLGTPAYMAPEQVIDGKKVGPLTDVYGLGAILYECLTGRPPFKCPTALETMEQVRTNEPIAPGRLQFGIQRDLQTICLKCLQKDPNQRYPSALAFAQDLDRFIRGEPIKARPTGIFTRGWKWALRRPTNAALLLISLLLTVGLIALIVTYTVRLRTEVDRANAFASESHRQQERASTNYRSARDALSLIVRHLDNRRATNIPQLMELRREQLEDALAFYEGALRGLEDSDPAVVLDTAMAAAAAGDIQHTLGREKASRESFQRALGLLEQLPADFRERPEARGGFIHCYKHLAYLANDQPRSTETYLLKARDEAEKLSGLDPSNPDWLNALVEGEHNLGVYFFENHQNGPAVEHYLRGIELRTGLISHHPKNEYFRAELGEDLLNLGLIYSVENEVDKAADVFRRADDLLRPLVESHPGDDVYGLSLSALYINWGILLRRTDLPEAFIKFNRAVELAEAALGREPHYPVARSRALNAHGARALALDQAGKLAEALSDWDRVVELADDDIRAHHRVNRAILMIKAGSYHRAAGEAHKLISDPRITDDNRYNLACILASLANAKTNDLGFGALMSVAAAEAHATAALDLLRRVHANGFFQMSGNTSLLTEDEDLAPLRTRADFQLLLKDMPAKR